MINKARKKRGQSALKTGNGGRKEEAGQRFKGRNFISPILLFLFVCLYALVVIPAETRSSGTNWFVVVMYAFLALMFYLRRPYLLVGSDFVQTRRMTGDKRLTKESIKGITVSKGSIVIEQVKGANWMFSRILNRYPTEEMGTFLEQFAQKNGIPFTQK